MTGEDPCAYLALASLASYYCVVIITVFIIGP